MSIAYNDGNKNHIIEISDMIEEEINFTVESFDYVNNKYVIDSNDGRLKINGNAYYSIPSSSLSTYFKGGLGEHMYCNLLNLNRADAEDFYHLTERSCTYDIVNCSETEKIDVKASFQKSYTKSFMHFLATNKPGINGVKISATKYKKNYQAEGINSVVCVDFFNDSSKLPNIYKLPSDSYEVKNYSTITITSSGKTFYNKYKQDISASFKNE